MNAAPAAAPSPLDLVREAVERPDASAVVRLRRTVYELRAWGIDAAGAQGIDYTRPSVQSSPRPETFTLAVTGPCETVDRVGEKLAALERRGSDFALPLAVLVWLRATASVDLGTPVRPRWVDLRHLLDGARVVADLRPARLALAGSWVAERFVPVERWKKWAKADHCEGELAWATAAEDAAVEAWASVAGWR